MKHEHQVSVRRPDGTLDVGTVNLEPSMTQQQYKDECDINNIMKKYSSTGEWPSQIKKGGIYGDFTEIGDYQSMCDKIARADEAFMALPAEVRLKFQNDPGKLLEFLGDKNNLDEAIKMGLALPKKINDDLNDDKIKKEMPSTKSSSPSSSKAE